MPDNILQEIDRLYNLFINNIKEKGYRVDVDSLRIKASKSSASTIMLKAIAKVIDNPKGIVFDFSPHTSAMISFNIGPMDSKTFEKMVYMIRDKIEQELTKT